jgi:DNA-binding NarL/FixJ family response regulator
MADLERNALAQNFLTRQLTSRERMLVAAFTLGFTQAEVARAWGVSPPSVCKMTKRIFSKAEHYWN